MATGWDRSEKAVKLRDAAHCRPGTCEHPVCESYWLRRIGLRTLPEHPLDRRNP